VSEGSTFDVIIQVVSDHLVQQFGHALDNRRLEHTARVSSDSSLTKKRVRMGILRIEFEENHLIINKLLCGIVFLQHRQELHDVGVLCTPRSVSDVTRVERDLRELAHILVKRVSGAIEAEDQVALSARGIGIRFPLARVLVRRVASEARVHFRIEGVSSDGDGGRTE